MAHEVYSQSGVSAGPTSSFLRDLFLIARAVVVALYNRYQAGKALSGFDERMLSDIGLRQEDLNSAFAEPFWRDPTRRLSVLAVERRVATRHVRAAERQASELIH
ncbi:DUF1127 domain-containing protein [Flaviflagellibacter deserti]|uniref:DUF1127 domain-containing protein n=1 Tax=Flaviflagellibacter deserti TaxID=2267266 RepID=A0ABV9YX38_9HYPH